MRELSIIYEGLDRVDGSARFGFGAPTLFPLYDDKVTTDIVRGHEGHLLRIWSD